MSDRPAGRRVRVVVLALAVAAVAGVGFLTWSIATSGSPERRAAAARDLAAGIEVSVGVDAVSHRATLAIADFGIEEGVRLVPVRILDEIQLELRLESNVDVALAEPPRVCLVGPHWAPDDAGLSDRCWGEPDLGALLAAQLEADAAGRPLLLAGRPVTVAATLARGHERCDYPVGAWTLEIDVEPMVDGHGEGRFDLPATLVDVPLEPSGTALRLVERGDSRYCGLAETVWREQGEPELVAP